MTPPASNSPLSGHTPVASVSWRDLALIGVAGAWLNSVAYGFRFDAGNQWFQLAQIRWLRNPSLYPGDPIRQAFACYPTAFPAIVAWLGRWAAIEHVLLGFFVLTKLLFFLALARLVGKQVRQRWLTLAIVAAVALSPVLNDLTPLAHSDVLDTIQTHTSLAIALLLWAGVLLIEERWVAAAAIAPATAYLDGLFVAHAVAAFAVFAVADWRRHRPRIVAAGLLGAAIALPWAFWTRGVVYHHYPPGYVQALVAFYPFHLTLASDDAYELVAAAGILAAAVAMGWAARQAQLAKPVILSPSRSAGAKNPVATDWASSGAQPEPGGRLERLVWAYGFLVVVGALAGEFFLTPSLARLQFLRADTFFDLYAVLLVQVCGARLLLNSGESASGSPTVPEPPATARTAVPPGKPIPAPRWAAGWLAILLPLGGQWALLWALLLALCWFRFSPQLRRAFRVDKGSGGGPRRALAVALAAGVLATFLPGWRQLNPVPRWSSLWDPVAPMSAEQADWRAAQLWAREHTPADSRFLVPTFPGGFRVFSERTSWGEWEDGAACYFYPPFAERYEERMTALGIPRGHWVHTDGMRENYRRQKWQTLVAIARQHRLGFIVQFRGAGAAARPLYQNAHYSVYPVTPQ
ncbi:MAG TPA: DUF6798 domain-containing protein [Candidatus Acidoferrales bacterium]|nr:DUF6798 domain-containing protein [Candidatus Acidoferrales bacterium]